MINCVRSFRFCSVYTVIIRCWSIAFLAVVTASSTLAFAVAFSSSVGRLIDFRFLALAAFLLLLFLSFLTTVGWILLIVSTPFVSQCLHLHYLLLVYRILMLSLLHRLSLLLLLSSSVAFGVWSISAFSFRRFINRCFASFLTTVGWILLIESKPFDFAVSTPSLFVTWSIDAHYLRPHRLSLLLLPSSSVASGV